MDVQGGNALKMMWTHNRQGLLCWDYIGIMEENMETTGIIGVT